GQTALTGDAINATASDLWRVGLVIVGVTLLLLLLFLRALLAPVYLLAASLLAVLGTLGLTVLICDALFGSPDLVYFVPFAAGVLLDTVVVRSLLVPSLVALTGRVGMWPGRQGVKRDARPAQELSDASH